MTTKPRRRTNRRMLVFVGAPILLALLLAGAYWGWKEQRARTSRLALRDGLAAFEQGDWQKARVQLGRYVAGHRDDVSILEKYALAQLRVRPLPPNNIVQAIGSLRLILRADPNNEKAFKRLTLLYEAIGDTAGLEQIANLQRGRNPDDPAAWLILGRVALQQRRENDAKEAFQKVLDLLRGTQPPRSEYGEAAFELCRLDIQQLGSAEARSAKDADERKLGALARLDEAASYDPNSAFVLIRRAELRRYFIAPDTGGVGTTQPSTAAQGELSPAHQLEAARQDLEQAERADLRDPRLRLALAKAWLALNEWDRAAAQLAATESIDPLVLEQYVVDPSSWVAERFQIAGVLALAHGDPAQRKALVTQVLKDLDGRPQRLGVLPLCAELLVAAADLDQARAVVKELRAAADAAPADVALADQRDYAWALVARAEQRPYDVIRLLQPQTTRAARKTIVQALLLEAYAQTGQTGRVNALLSQGKPAQLPPSTAVSVSLALLNQQDWTKAQEMLAGLGSDQPEGGLLTLQRFADLGRLIGSNNPEDRARLASLQAELEQERAGAPDRVDLCLLLAMVKMYAGGDDGEQQAEAELKRGLEACSDHLPLRLMLARLYAGRADGLPAALQQLEEACRESATMARPWIERASLLVLAGRATDAEQVLADGLKQIEEAERQAKTDEKESTRRERRDIQLEAARLAATAEHSDVALQSLRDLSNEDKTDLRPLEAMLWMPAVLSDPNNHPMDLIEQLRKIEGDTGVLWRLHEARFLLAAMDPTAGGPENEARRRNIEADLKLCIEANPRWVTPILILGRFYSDFERYADAETLYATAWRESGVLQAADELVRLYQRQDKLPEARRVLNEMKTELGPMATASRLLNVAVLEENYDEAIRQAEMSTSDKRSRPDDLIRLARLYYLRSQRPNVPIDARAAGVKQALDALDRAEKEGADRTEVNSQRVRIYTDQQRPDDAVAVLNAFVEQEKSWRAYELRGRYYGEVKGQEAKAESDFLEVQRLIDADAKGRESLDKDTEEIGYALLGDLYARESEDAWAAGDLATWRAKLDQAIETWRKPNDPSAMVRKGLLKGLLLRGDRAGSPEDIAQVDELLSGLLKDRPNDLELLWIQAMRLPANSASDQKRASEIIARAQKATNSTVQAYAGLARLARLKFSDANGARRILTAGLERYPREPELLVERAWALRALGDPTNARADVEQAVSRLSRMTDSAAPPLTQELLDLQVTIAGQLGDVATLATLSSELSARVKENPEDAHLRLLYAQVLQGKKEESQAIATLADFLQSAPPPANFDVLLALAGLERDTEDFNAAQGHLDQADAAAQAQLDAADAATDPQQQDRMRDTGLQMQRVALRERLLLLAAQKKYDDLQRVATTDPRVTGDVDLQYAVAWLLSDSPAHLAAAEELCAKVAAQAPNNPSVQAHLGNLRYRRGDVAGAEAAYRTILKPNDPVTVDNAEVANNLAWLLAVDRHTPDALKEAVPLARAAVTFDPNNVDYRDTLGVVLEKDAQLREAAEQFDRARTLYREQAAGADKTGKKPPPVLLYLRPTLHAARVKLGLGNAADARKLFDEVQAQQDALPDTERAELDALRQQLSQAAPAGG